MKRSNDKINVEFVNGKDRFITEEMVNNLLIVKPEQPGKQGKDSLDLNVLEFQLNQSSLIANAEVYRTITGELGVEVTQREPLARIIGEKSFYIDKEGVQMPLSGNFSARVPLVTGVDSTAVFELYPFLKEIDKDVFLKKNIIGIERITNGDYHLKMRESDWMIVFGDMNDIEQKIKNFKAFYSKAYADELLDDYSQINLKYINQVVCTKKES